jgi:hypothetical protein
MEYLEAFTDAYGFYILCAITAVFLFLIIKNAGTFR